MTLFGTSYYVLIILYDNILVFFILQLQHVYFSSKARRVQFFYKCRFNRDLKWRTGVEIVSIQCNSFNDFRITGSALEEAYQEGVLVTNPSNPLGITLSLLELNLLVNFIDAKGIHLISDEIYLGPVQFSLCNILVFFCYIQCN